MLQKLRQPLHQTIRVVNNPANALFHTATVKLNSTPEHNEHNPTLERIKKELAQDKEKLQWRTKAGDGPDDFITKFKFFENSEQTSDYIVMMQQPVNLSPKGIKTWFEKRRERNERFMQQFITERHQLLGAELAAAHFILYRGGAVKFFNKNWMQADEDGRFDLPGKFHPDYKIEAMRCDNVTLYYEGLENIRCLQHIKFLSFHNVTTFDDWCLDRVSGSQYSTLEILDISGTKCTYNGLSCLYRIPSLQLLIVDDPKQSMEYELTCAMLEEAIPKLKVIAASDMHGEAKS